jgi:hypothetical protein
MAAAIRIKLSDLLSILMEKPPVIHEQRTRQIKLFKAAPANAERRPLNLEIEKDLEAIKAYLLNGPAQRSDLDMVLNLSDGAVLRRIHLLKERGVVVGLPGHRYQLREAA